MKTIRYVIVIFFVFAVLMLAYQYNELQKYEESIEVVKPRKPSLNTFCKEGVPYSVYDIYYFDAIHRTVTMDTLLIKR